MVELVRSELVLLWKVAGKVGSDERVKACVAN
jgi:hypothetical protein